MNTPTMDILRKRPAGIPFIAVLALLAGILNIISSLITLSVLMQQGVSLLLFPFS